MDARPGVGGARGHAADARDDAGAPVRTVRGRARCGSFGLPIVEDAAQAHRRASTAAQRGPTLAAYSFYPTKNLGRARRRAARSSPTTRSCAERAAHAALARRARRGARRRASCPGVNSRLDEVQAEILSRRLARLDEGNRAAPAACRVLPRRAEGRRPPGRARGDAPLLAPVRRAGRRPRGIPREAARARRRDARPLPRADPPPARLAHLAGSVPLTVSERPVRAGRQPAALSGADRRRGGAGRRGGERGVRLAPSSCSTRGSRPPARRRIRWSTGASSSIGDDVSIYADLYRYRELFANLFRRDLQTRYKGSVLGVAWSLRQPARADGDLRARLLGALEGDARSRTTRSTCWSGWSSGSSSRPR